MKVWIEIIYLLFGFLTIIYLYVDILILIFFLLEENWCTNSVYWKNLWSNTRCYRTNLIKNRWTTKNVKKYRGSSRVIGESTQCHWRGDEITIKEGVWSL